MKKNEKHSSPKVDEFIAKESRGENVSVLMKLRQDFKIVKQVS